MITIPIYLEERDGTKRRGEPVSLGIPFPKGAVQKKNRIALFDAQGTAIPVAARVTGSWPDGSIRWALLDFQTSQDQNSLEQFNLRTDVMSSVADASISVDELDTQFQINTGAAEFIINKQHFKPFQSVLVDSEMQFTGDKSEVVLIDEHGHALQPVLDAIDCHAVESGLTCRVTTRGRFSSSAGTEDLALFTSNLFFYAGCSFVKLEFTLHNPHVATHPGGLWDLGGKGSLIFKELSLRLPVDENELYWKENASTPWHQEKSGYLSIYQDSSGGENWKGNNHKNRNGEISHRFKGYRCQNDGGEIASGDRISPYVFIGDATRGITIHIRQFWQNFPKAIDVGKGWLSLQLFPGKFDDVFELQGGEQKTHTMFLDFGGNRESLNWAQSPLIPRLPLEWYKRCDVLPYLSDSSSDEIDELIRAGVEGAGNFFAKREIVDEFGWRNFGELYADHEALGYQGEQPLVSHYNNQYDVIYGFARQFVASGDYRWFELMDDLARHVADIDIYRTQEDRAEYNGGLFWHTNHYLDALTCTHRTFSRDHPAVTSDGPSGGGPGSEHCYTTGLLYHYYLTGSEASRDALLTLSSWISRLNRSPETVLGKLLLLQKTGLPQLIKMLRREKVYQYKKPLTRGAGNYISTLLDTFELTGDPCYVRDAAIVIQQTIHPNDNIQSRSLENVEVAWSYTVFLQAVGKYLDTKVKLGQEDAAFHYARYSLLSYANWMLMHEYPYLEKPEILDYPNQTWVAQEIRKANTFLLAYKYSGATNQSYIDKAYFFLDYIKQELDGSEQAQYSRILAVLMQNHGLHAYSWVTSDYERFRGNGQQEYGDVPIHTLSTLLREFIAEVVDALKNFSFASEIRWLRSRLHR